MQDFFYNFSSSSIFLTISKFEDNFTLFINESFILNFKSLSGLPFGFISFFALSPVHCDDCLTKISRMNFYDSGGKKQNISKSVDSLSKKILKEDFNKRQLKKALRRVLMLTTSDYIENITQGNEKLDGNFRNFSDSLQMIKEAVFRTRQGITNDQILYFIHTHVEPILKKASNRFSHVSDALWYLKIDLLKMQQYVTEQLTNLNFQVQEECQMVQNESVELLKNILKINSSNSPLNWDISRWLFYIAASELIAIVLFFFKQHRRIKNIKLH